LVRGRAVALVSNHSGRLADGSHLADALAAQRDVRLVALFGMEYDIRSNDYSVPRDPERTRDARTGVPKYSLYGEQHKPSPEMLDGVDVLLYDIQDVGARFYEHVNILGFIMEAAAERGIRVVVLDRPNPLGGRGADGFVADSQAFYRFGSYTAIPALHGMTPGELARFYNGERRLRGGRMAELHVVPMRGWTRDQWFDQTGQSWRKPSPNLVTFSSLIAYAGTCLFEAVNVSAGRGSDTPFELIGAPWLAHERAVVLLKGRSRVRDAPRAVLCAESRRAGTADVRPQREGGDVPVGQVRGANGGHRDGRPAGVPRPSAGPHPRQRARHDAVLRVVCQPSAGHAPEGGADRSRGAAGDRPRTTAGPDRGIPTVGDPDPTAL
jgi:hypothetical protein